MLRLHVNLSCLDDLVIARTRGCLHIDVDLSKHELNRVRQDLDQTLSQKVGLAIKEAKQVTDVTIDGPRCLF